MRLRYHPRLRLAVSAALLLCALAVLWLALDRPLPAADWACRRLERENLFPRGVTLASGPIRYRQADSGRESWFVRRSGDRYALLKLERVAGLFWRPAWGGYLELPLSEEAPILAYPVGLAMLGGGDERSSEWVVAAVSRDPRMVRVEATLCWVAAQERDDPAAAYVAHGVPVALSEAAPGSGVWISPPTRVDFTPASGHGSGVWLGGYDSAGALIYDSGPQ